MTLVTPSLAQSNYQEPQAPQGGFSPQGAAAIDDSYDYEFNGMYQWGDVVTQMCYKGYCRVSLPQEFYNMQVPLAIAEKTFESAFKALGLQAQADGWLLTLSGKGKNRLVSAKRDVESTASYISCIDTTVRTVSSRDLFRFKIADSLKCLARDNYVPVLPETLFVPSSRYRVSFYVVSDKFLQNMGVSWTEVWATGSLTRIPKFITDWTLRAVESGDSTCEFRSVELDIDTLASIHWGGKVKEQTSTTMNDNFVTQNYEYRDFGLTLTLRRSLKYGISGSYALVQNDELNSTIEGNFGGGGLDSIVSYGIYDSWQQSTVGIPFISRIPLIGYLFSYKQEDKVKQFFVIEINKISDAPSRSFGELDSLSVVKRDRFTFGDTTEVDNEDTAGNKLDTLDIPQAEVLDDSLDIQGSQGQAD